MPLPTVVIDKDMSITHDEFFRVAPRALGVEKVRRDGGVIAVGGHNQRLDIMISDETVRRIGALALPVTKVRLRFTGYSDTEVAAFLHVFDRAFQRGGG